MNSIDAMIAPRALTATELAQVLVPHLIAYAVTERAFTHAGTIADGGIHDSGTVHTCEGVLYLIVEDAMASVNQWLADMDGGGEPRFYRKASVKEAVRKLAAAAALMALRQETPGDFQTLLELLSGRDAGTLETVIAMAGE